MANGLIQLAREGTATSKGRLFLTLADMVVKDIDRRTDQELELFAEITLQLYSSASADDRCRLARRMARSARLPGELAKRFASDDIAVALPVLTHSPVFSENDLLDLVESLGSQHLQVLAGRPNLGTEVTDALVRRGDSPVHRIIAGNREIQLSRESMVILVQEALRDVVLREDLLLREDLTPSACETLTRDAGSAANENRRTQGATNPPRKEDHIARLRRVRRKLGAALEAAEPNRLLQAMKHCGASVNEVTILLLEDKRFMHVVAFLAAASQTNPQVLKNAVFAGDADVIMDAAQACGMDAATFTIFSAIRCENMRIPPSTGLDWSTAYKARLAQTPPAKPEQPDSGSDAKAKDKSNGQSDFGARRKPRRDRTRSKRERRVAVI